MTTLETLKAARAKIANRKHWTQDVSARDADGGDVPPIANEAVCWCAVGAVVAQRDWNYQALKLLDRLSELPSHHEWERPAARFNDTHTHAEVLALFDKAIAEAQ